jgi:NADPH2:quinone reductase
MPRQAFCGSTVAKTAVRKLVGLRSAEVRRRSTVVGDIGTLIVPKVLMADGHNGLRYIDAPSRPLEVWQVRVAVARTLISPGTELHYLDLAVQTGSRYPLGYCAAGRVTEVGAKASDLRPGDRVISMGWGAAVHADEIVIPHLLCCRIPDHVTFDDAVIANLAATAVHALDRGCVQADDDVTVIGAGIIGQLVAQSARARTTGAVTVVDVSDERLATVHGGDIRTMRGAEFGASTHEMSSSARCSFVCVSGEATTAMRAAITWVAVGKSRGRVVAVGRFTASIDFSVELGNVDIRVASRCGTGYRDDAYLSGQRSAEAPLGEATVDRNLARALDLVTSGVLGRRHMTIPVAPFTAAASVYDRLRTDHSIVSTIFRYEPASGSS